MTNLGAHLPVRRTYVLESRLYVPTGQTSTCVYVYIYTVEFVNSACFTAKIYMYLGTRSTCCTVLDRPSIEERMMIK